MQTGRFGVSQVARALGISESRVRQIADELAVLKKPGSRRSFTAGDIEKLRQYRLQRLEEARRTSEKALQP